MSERRPPLARDDGPAATRDEPPSPVAFGDFRLDAARRELRRRGETVRVEPKVLDLLAYLVRHRDRVVSRDEILDALWADEHVSDAALSYCVKEARKAVGDTGDAQHTIATVHRRGFRFVAAVDAPPRGLAPPTEGTAPALGAFVGRESIMARLAGVLGAARGGHVGIVLLSGEPGIGKTRIADELSRIALGEGFVVLTGRCYESTGTPPFWPWMQILRAFVACRGADTTRELLQGAAADLAAWAPELADIAEAAAPSEDAGARFRLFDGTASFLRRASAQEPLLLIVDDLQWADAATLLLLRFVARELLDARIVLLAAYRDTEVNAPHPLLDCSADLIRIPGSERFELKGLSAADLARFIEAASGAAPAALVERIHRQTGGNPFFATESVRLLASADAARDAASAVPGTVREVVARRLETLSEPARRLLRVGAILGREFDVADVRRIREGGRLPPQREILRALDEARAARVIEPCGGEGRQRFSHDLVRETIYDALPSDQRAGLHERAGRAIESARRDDLGPHLATLAHHFACAAVGGEPARAIDYARRAGDRAASLLAYEEAASHYERALELAARAERPALLNDTSDALLLALGENVWKAGDFGRAREVSERITARARERNDAALLAHAALGFGGGFRGFDVHVTDPDLIALLEEAFARLPERRSALRARVMARLAVALYDVPGSLERRRRLTADAVRDARHAGDEAVLVDALYSRHWAIWGPDTLDDRIRTARAMVRLAEKLGDREAALKAHRFLVIDSLEDGDRVALDRHLARCVELGDQLRQPYFRWYAAQLVAERALVAGRVEDSERLLAEAVAIGRRADSRNVELAYHSLLFYIRRQQGRLLEVEPIVRAIVDRHPGFAAWRFALAVLYADTGRPAEARLQLDAFAPDDFAGVRRDVFWLSAMSLAADACATARVTEHAATLYRLLAPYAGRIADVALGGGCLGAVDRWLGRLAALEGHERKAAEHFGRALRLERALGAPLLAAETERAAAA